MAIAAICTMTGAGGALGTEAITSLAHDSHNGDSRAASRHRDTDHFLGRAGRFLGRAVHAEAVVATNDGFKNVVLDRGKVKSVSGQSLTITEGTKTATYKDVTLTIPSDAKIHVPGKSDATLADLQAGWKVVVTQLPGRTVVKAAPARTHNKSARAHR